MIAKGGAAAASPISSHSVQGSRKRASARACAVREDSSEMSCNYSAGMADVRQGGTIGLPAKTLVNASMTLPPFLRMVEM